MPSVVAEQAIDVPVIKAQSKPNHLNVFAGENAMKQYYDPSCHPHLPLVELPASLNPYRQDGVHIYAKMMTFLPAHNVKALPALNMLQSTSKLVKPETKRVVEYSSGSTVISMAVISRVLHGIDDVHAYLSNKTSRSKLRLMQFFGLKISVFGGPSQPRPLDHRGGIQAAATLAADSSDTVNPNQYENVRNYEAHMRWTGPQILEQLPQIDCFAAGLGTSGTMTGIGTFLKRTKPSVTRIGVCTAPGDRVPGPRSYALLDPVQFPWRDAIDAIEEVGSEDSFRASMMLSREGIVCGPSSGFNLIGLLSYLEKQKRAGRLAELSTRGDGQLHCAFICCDLPYQYIDEYFTKLGADAFESITNENLLTVDTYRYDDAWELAPQDFLELLRRRSIASNSTSSGKESFTDSDREDCGVEMPYVIDLRDPADFATHHLPNANNYKVSSLSENQVSPFRDASVLEKQWKEVDRTLADFLTINGVAKSRSVACVDYTGDTARMATSILRAQGWEAWSLGGGMSKLLLCR